MKKRIQSIKNNIKSYVKHLFLCFSIVCLFISYSIDGYTYTVEEIYNNFKTAYEKSKNFSAEFEEITLFKTRKSVSSGRFMFGKPNLLRKEFLAPKNPDRIIKTIVLDGTHVWSYVPLYNQVNKTKLEQSQRRELLPGMGASLEDVPLHWNMKLVPDEAANAKGVYQIQLTLKIQANKKTPNKSSKATSEDSSPPPPDIVNDGTVNEIIEIWVKEGEWLPVQFGYTVEHADGSRTNVITKLSKIERDTKLPTDLFKFNIPKNAEVIDFSDN